jgi:hypothetical protein
MWDEPRNCCGGVGGALNLRPLPHAQNVPTRGAVTVMRMMVAVAEERHIRDGSRCMVFRQSGETGHQLQFESLVNKFTRPTGPCGHGRGLL